MGSEWVQAKIGQVAHRVTKGTTPTTVGGHFVDAGISFVKVESITDDGRFDTAKFAFIDEDTNQLLSRSVLKEDDVLFTIAGTIGRVARVPLSILPANTNQAVAIVRPNPEVIDPRFLCYVLRDELRVRLAHTRVVQSVQSNLSLSELSEVEIPLPKKPEQRAIAHILGTLDDKIDLNRRMNETLEWMAQAIFNSWFVDFDPVRAKAQGLDPGLPKHIADLFPDSFEDSELGEIPAGWEVQRVGEIGSIICGKTPPTQVSEYYGGDVPFITIPDMHGRIFATATQKRLSRAGADSQEKKMLPVGSICVSCIATAGLVVITSKAAHTNQQINSVVPSQKDSTYFWFWPLRNLGDEIRAGGSGGSVLTNLSTGRFAELRLLSGIARLRSAYHSHVTPIFGRILVNECETRTLSALRDTLLPKLISGKLRVGDTQRFIGESA